MKELFSMWRNTRMIVLTAVTAALYAAVLIAFKPIPIIPGTTELRPANAIPVVCSLLFGPAAAWGAAIGNLISDFFGTLGPGTFFGFIGNFLFGLIPYKLWRAFTGRFPDIKSFPQVLLFILVSLCASVGCGLFIGWGLDLLSFYPFFALANIITINNFLFTVLLGPFLMYILCPRVQAWGLYYTDVMDDLVRKPWMVNVLGILLVMTGSLGGYAVGNVISYRIITGQTASAPAGPAAAQDNLKTSPASRAAAQGSLKDTRVSPAAATATAAAQPEKGFSLDMFGFFKKYANVIPTKDSDLVQTLAVFIGLLIIGAVLL